MTISAVRSSAPTLPPTGGQDPNAPIGKGDPSARWVGGLTGAAVGVGVTAAAVKGLRLPTGSPLQFVGVPLTIGGAFAGQHLLGTATRGTVAESARAREAAIADREIQIRQLRAQDGLEPEDVRRIEELRKDRLEQAEAKAEGNKLATWGGAALGAAALGVGLAMVAYRLTPDDGKGINQMFNSIGAGGAGGVLGLWAGGTAGSLVGRNHHAELPASNREKIAEIDRELDSILGPA